MLLWKRYGNNKMAAILHLQQYSHRLNLFLFFYLFMACCYLNCSFLYLYVSLVYAFCRQDWANVTSFWERGYRGGT